MFIMNGVHGGAKCVFCLHMGVVMVFCLYMRVAHWYFVCTWWWGMLMCFVFVAHWYLVWWVRGVAGGCVAGVVAAKAVGVSW